MTISTDSTDGKAPEVEREANDVLSDDLGETAVVTTSQRLLDPLDLAIARALERDESGTVKLGDTSLKAYIMPGHTPGSLTYTFTAFDNKKPHKAIIFGGPGPRNGVAGGTEFLASIERLQKDFADYEVAVNVHSYLNGYPYTNGGLLERRDMMKPGAPNPFIDNASWRAWLKKAHEGDLQYIEDAKKADAAKKTN